MPFQLEPLEAALSAADMIHKHRLSVTLLASPQWRLLTPHHSTAPAAQDIWLSLHLVTLTLASVIKNQH